MSNTQSEKPAKLFRNDLDQEYFARLHLNLGKTELGRRICSLLDAEHSDLTIRGMNTYMAKHGFIYICAKVAREESLSELEQSTLDKFFALYEVRCDENSELQQAVAESAL